ncbi:Phosphate transport system permease protein PstC [BD1-7 clade bacterium]|uniref:Phosphate transport system permease protein PstC n=1 Tax=BD1-7 clade bacterium TaxID=2029982 RepID=A0A5S9NKA4_9GAMM|nr:Phosphate transport system permease protein PstC [BD1-7 clade bacterium]CAA0093602.1 Phosphate transport system permease protein PstC [BD1-7 clade bacterium]
MTVESTKNAQPIVDFDSPKIHRYNRIRHFKDKFATVGIAVGGVGVIAAILLIFLYLLYEVVPLFQSADVEPLASYTVPGEDAKTLYMAVEEQNEIGLRVTDQGDLIFFDVADGGVRKTFNLPIPAGETVTSLSVGSEASGIMALGLSGGGVLIAKHDYRISYPDDKRVIDPRVVYPYGEDIISLSDGGAVDAIAIRSSEEKLTLIGHVNNQLIGRALIKEEDFLTEEVTLVPEDLVFPPLVETGDEKLGKVHLDIDQRFIVVQVGNQRLDVINLRAETVQTIHSESRIDSAKFLLGGISLLVAYDNGTIGQWFMVRGEEGSPQLTEIRSFETEYKGPIVKLAIEQRRKGFASVTGDGHIELFHSTAHRNVFDGKLIEGAQPNAVAMSPRANRLLVEASDNQIHVFEITNNHPEISWSSLWSKVWYESYDEPRYVWQSSSSSNDFEPKMSLMPLSFGTLKAAFYAMLLGAPLAICGAIYTAYFMTPVMRRKIKPLIELMEALPTVILGFLAGLWLAPFMENNLAAIFTILLVMPFAILGFAYLMSRLPVALQNRINEGWHGFILIPVVILVGAACMGGSPWIESAFFDGSMRTWISNDLGIPFDQRNALVVGVAMGFAVIPTIFSIAEDAIFSVPKHLSYGSLALGATPWQTMLGVVLPTASPGIFSGLMIGLGRAVGETMIVLMATGNTPIMDANIFEGMRTLSANLAVEVPEAEVDSTHYRVLFLAAFVLFIFTFVVNTAAEIVRQRLRKKYGSL